MNKNQNAVLAMLGLILSLGAPAEASLFSFSYTSENNQVLAGTVIGELQPDGNTVHVSTVEDFATLDGAAGPSLPYIYKFSDWSAADYTDPIGILTFDGLGMDFIALTGSTGGDGFAFCEALTTDCGSASVDQFLASAPFGGGSEALDVSRWQLNQVPLPTTAVLLLVGLAGLRCQVRIKPQVS